MVGNLATLTSNATKNNNELEFRSTPASKKFQALELQSKTTTLYITIETRHRNMDCPRIDNNLFGTKWKCAKEEIFTVTCEMHK